MTGKMAGSSLAQKFVNKEECKKQLVLMQTWHREALSPVRKVVAYLMAVHSPQ